MTALPASVATAEVTKGDLTETSFQLTDDEKQILTQYGVNINDLVFKEKSIRQKSIS